MTAVLFLGGISYFDRAVCGDERAWTHDMTRTLSAARKDVSMGKQSESSPAQLAEAQRNLKSAHAKLVKEFEKLHNAEFSAASHKAYLEKLRAHLSALEAHTAAMHAQRQAVHAQREALHEKHEADATAHPARSPRKPRSTRSR